MTDVERLGKILAQSSSAGFFGGAGMSTESGIPDFPTGIYNQKLNQTFSPEEMASHYFFVQHPEEFFAFYRERFVYLDAKTNPGHLALAELERRGHLSALVTQNIDGLHQLAGSQVFYELHPSICRSLCLKCGAMYGFDYSLNNTPFPPCVHCGRIVKPDVLLYGETLDVHTLSRPIHAFAVADSLIVGGIHCGGDYRFSREHFILINKTASPAVSYAELVIREPIGKTLEKAIRNAKCAMRN